MLWMLYNRQRTMRDDALSRSEISNKVEAVGSVPEAGCEDDRSFPSNLILPSAVLLPSVHNIAFANLDPTRRVPRVLLFSSCRCTPLNAANTH